MHDAQHNHEVGGLFTQSHVLLPGIRLSFEQYGLFVRVQGQSTASDFKELPDAQVGIEDSQGGQ